jgi:hypothetical protein
MTNSRLNLTHLHLQKNIVRARWGLLPLALTLTACSDSDSEALRPIGASTLALTTAVGTDSPITSISMRVQQVNCFDGTPTSMSPLVSELEPEQFAPSTSSDPASPSPDSAHSYAETSFALPAGCYDVSAVPDAASECFGASRNAVQVSDGEQVDVLLIVQCLSEDPGVLDILGLTNHEPEFASGVSASGALLQGIFLADASGEPNSSGGVIQCGEQQVVCINVRDPDGDAFEIVWSFTDSQGSIVGNTPVLRTGPDADGYIRACVAVDPAPSGQVDYSVSVFDLLGDGTRIEDWLANPDRQQSGSLESHAAVAAHYVSDVDECQVSPSGVSAVGDAFFTEFAGNAGGGTLFEDTCAGGSVLVGVTGDLRAGATFLGQMEAVCAPLLLTGGGSEPFAVTTGAPTSLPRRGVFGGGDPYSVLCPVGAAVVGFEGRGGALVDQLVLSCAPFVVTETPTAFGLTLGVAQLLPPAGGNGGSPFAPQACPPEQAATGARIRGGDSIDGFAVQCQAFALTLPE